MQKMKRIMAWIALVAVMLSSFAFAEDIELVETPAPVAVEQTVEPTAEPVATQEPVAEEPVEEPTEEPAEPTEAPVEEAPVEEAPVEEAPVEEVSVEEAPVEEAPVEEAAEPVLLSEEHEHYMVCTKPGVCYECGAELNSEDYNWGHNTWNEEENRDKWVDIGNGKHALQCVYCDIVLGEAADHGVSCWNEDTSRCQDCGASLEGMDIELWHDFSKDGRDNWVDLGNGNHALQCVDCSAYFEENEHWADCRTPGKCGECGLDIDPEVYGEGHNNYNEELKDWIYRDLGNGKHVEICQNCGEEFNEGDHWPDCTKGGKCGECGAELDPEEYGEGHYMICTEPGVCQNCGIELDPADYNYGHNGWDEEADEWVWHDLGDGTHAPKCNICGKYFNIEEHWAVCSNGVKCGDCGIELDPADYDYGHDGWDEAYGDWRGYDQGDGTHAYKCRYCDEYFGSEEHTYVNGVCICGAENSRLEALTVAGKLTLGAGQVSTVEYEVTGSAKEIAFKSSKTSVVTVDENGTITAKKTGTAKISVTAIGFEGEKITKSISVTVKKAPTKVALSVKKVVLAQGETFALKGKLSPAGAVSEPFWATDDASVATVDASGVITAVAPGEAAITLSTYNGKFATCVVTVLAAPTGIELDKAEIILNPKGSYAIAGKLVNSEGLTCGGAISYKSADASVATVSSTGKVTAKKVGETTITVETYNGCTAELLVRVMATPKKVTLTPNKATMNKGDTISLAASVNDGAYTTYKWSTSSKKVATVDANGFVTALKEGSVTITVKTANGKSAKAKITVVDPYKPTKVELSQTGTVTIGVGETLALNATLYPETAQSALKWSTSSKKVATVDANGVVTGVKAGTATITVTTENGKKDSVKVKVVKSSDFDSYKGNWKLTSASYWDQTVSGEELGQLSSMKLSISEDKVVLMFMGDGAEMVWRMDGGQLVIENFSGYTAVCSLSSKDTMVVRFSLSGMEDMTYYFTK